jgi:hypothetical protein
MRRLVSPGRFGLVDQKRIPKNLIAVQVVGMFTESRADNLLFVPKVYDSGIGEKRGGPFVSRVGIKAQSPPEDFEGRIRDFRVIDPDGNKLDFCTRLTT